YATVVWSSQDDAGRTFVQVTDNVLGDWAVPTTIAAGVGRFCPSSHSARACYDERVGDPVLSVAPIGAAVIGWRRGVSHRGQTFSAAHTSSRSFFLTAWAPTSPGGAFDDLPFGCSEPCGPHEGAQQVLATSEIVFSEEHAGDQGRRSVLAGARPSDETFP